MKKDINFLLCWSSIRTCTISLLSKQAKYAVVPEPVLSTVMAKNNDIKIILSLNDEWIKGNNVENGYPQSTLLIKEEFYNKIKDTNSYDKLIEAFDESGKWVIDNPQLAAEKCEELGITVNKDVINESIKNSNLRFTTIEDSKKEYEAYFSTIDDRIIREKVESMTQYSLKNKKYSIISIFILISVWQIVAVIIDNGLLLPSFFTVLSDIYIK